MLSKAVVRNLVNALSVKADHNEVNWTITPEGAYCVDLQQFRIRLSPAGGNQETDPDIVFEVDTPDGNEVGAVQVKLGDSEYESARHLLERADAFIMDWNRLLEEAAQSIQTTSGRIGGTARGGTSVLAVSPPPPPPRPTDDQARRFFGKIAGQWILDYSAGIETLTIDANGNYFIQPKPNQATRLQFRLSLNACDETLEHVELAKQELNGKTRQIEVLTISDDVMHGYAKHDEHELKYKRLT